jgi:hypothetical protein
MLEQFIKKPKLASPAPALAKQGYHGVENLFPDRDAFVIFGDDVLPKGQQYADLVKANKIKPEATAASQAAPKPAPAPAAKPAPAAPKTTSRAPMRAALPLTTAAITAANPTSDEGSAPAQVTPEKKEAASSSGVQPLYTLGRPDGLKKEGNLNLNNRPIVHNADGSLSTEYSISFGTDDGEVLVPTVVDGKFLTPDGKKPPEGSQAEKDMFEAAKQHYRETGENMGVFDTPEHADTYANQVHNRQDSRYNFQTAGKMGTADTLSLLDKAAQDYDLDPRILYAQARQESGLELDNEAVSSKGARGVMQLMPRTAKSLGVDARDPAQNVDGGARLMGQLHKRFGRYDRALAAYDWSPDKVQAAIDTYGDKWLEHTPEETQKYVHKILRNAAQ